jgi:hypothetical protein
LTALSALVYSLACEKGCIDGSRLRETGAGAPIEAGACESSDRESVLIFMMCTTETSRSGGRGSADDTRSWVRRTWVVVLHCQAQGGKFGGEAESENSGAWLLAYVIVPTLPPRRKSRPGATMTRVGLLLPSRPSAIISRYPFPASSPRTTEDSLDVTFVLISIQIISHFAQYSI